ncbi:MAG TPA: DALR anticodon-binding domain-containing protein, partial [Burkholderiaceae bacterium]
HADHGAQALEASDAELTRLTAATETALLRTLARYPEVLARAADEFAPHDLTFYLRDVAASFHTYYAAERFLVDDHALARARMALLTATRQVLRNGFALLGISAPASMSRDSIEESA